LKEELKKYYEGRKIKEDTEVSFVKRSNVSPHSGEMKRIMLAFESQLQDEIRFALNFLLMYSCSDISPIILEEHPMIFEGLLRYLTSISKNCPQLLNSEGLINLGGELNIEKNYNQEVHKLVTSSSLGPIESLRSEKKLSITARYEEISAIEILEQVRIILQILRNLVFSKLNDRYMFEREEFLELMINFLFNSLDKEVCRLSLDSISILCKHIILEKLSGQKVEVRLLDKIIEYLGSDHYEEYEAALECIHNLMLSQENEISIESLLPNFIGNLVWCILTLGCITDVKFT